MTYQDAWKFLDNLQFFKIKLGLDSMAMFLEELGRPQDSLRFVHVAGTNGKGSTAATLLAMLAAAGYRVGLYTSPHLSSVRERFRINDEYIAPEDFALQAGRIQEILQGRQITYFEFTTALALLWFESRQVDLAIMEVGLGGRLDATNVITPLVSIITNVSMDHEAYLGHTLEAVAGEKAGIVKDGVVVVSAAGQDEEDREGVVQRVVEETCRVRRAPLYLYGRDFTVERETDGSWSYWSMQRRGRCRVRKTLAGLLPRLKGEYQRQNAGLALAAVELLADHGFAVSDEASRTGLSQVNWPGRLEYFTLPVRQKTPEDSRTYLLDGAHNPAGVASLVQALEQAFKYDKLVLVWGAMADKDLAGTLPLIASLADRLVLTTPGGERSARPADLLKLLPRAKQPAALCEDTVSPALQRAVALAGPKDLICVAGSLYLVGAARRQLLGGLED